MGRALFVLAIVVVVVLVIYGAIYITRTDDTVNITFDKTKFRQVGEKAAQESREAARKVGQGLEKAGEKLQETPEAERNLVPAESPR